MKTTIDKEFFEKWKYKNVAMWCKKREYAKEFCKLMHEQGLKWSKDESHLGKNSWDRHTTETAYSLNTTGGFCYKEWYKENNYTILDFEDYIIKEEKEKMSKEELVELMIENFTNEYGALELSELDFTKYKCDVDISHMKVSGTLVQNNQKVQGDLLQNNQEVRKNLYQRNQEVQGDLSQSSQTVQGNLHQGNQEVQGNLFQNKQSVQGSLYQTSQEVKKGLYQDKFKNEKDEDKEINQNNNSSLTKEMLVKLLVENFANEHGELDLSDLDFSGYDLDIDISGIKTRGDIYQGEHTTKGYIYQGHHITNKDIYQSDHITKGNIYQLRNKMGGELFQESQNNKR